MYSIRAGLSFLRQLSGWGAFGLILSLCLWLPPSAALGMGSANIGYTAGFRTLGVWKHAARERLDVAVWYPAYRSGRMAPSHRAGDWKMAVGREAKPVPGLFPVILLSHDMGRQNLANHDLATALARAGFVVIAPTHTGDSVQEGGYLYTASMFYRRPRQLALALEAVAQDAQLGRLLDRSRVGLLGVGTGGLSVLQLAGVDIDPQGVRLHCRDNSRDNVFCAGWVQSRLADLPADAAEIRAKLGKRSFAPELPNIKVVGLLTPGGLFFLNKKELAELKMPMAVLFAGEDELYPPALSGEAMLQLFPSPFYDYVNTLVVPGADHYSLGAICPDEIAASLPELCGSVPSGERGKMQRQRDEFFVSFFRASLGVPLPAPGAAQSVTP